MTMIVVRSDTTLVIERTSNSDVVDSSGTLDATALGSSLYGVIAGPVTGESGGLVNVNVSTTPCTFFGGTVSDFVDLPLGPACERFYERDSRVGTASRASKTAVNDGGPGRWLAYATQLEPLIAELRATEITDVFDAASRAREGRT